MAASVPLTLELGMAKVPRWGRRESGDTLELVERPRGGISAVLIDAPGSGVRAKGLSSQLAAVAVELILRGVRDGAVARGVADHLYAARRGQVVASMHLVSLDLPRRSLVLSRNSEVPFFVARNGGVEAWAEPCDPLGRHDRVRPVIRELDLEPGLTVLACTDGILHAGRPHGAREDLPELLAALLDPQLGLTTQEIADAILEDALERDRGRPADDMAVLVCRLLPRPPEGVTRRLWLQYPLVQRFDG